MTAAATLMRSRPAIGFVILSHRAPDQLLRLVRALCRLYGDPPIACHHDFGQVPLDRSAFPSNVRFVQPWVATGWGKWSVVRAFLRALAMLYQGGHEDPEWFVLLSGADYPIAPADAVLGELRESGCDAFMDVHQIDPLPVPATLVGDVNPLLRHLDSEVSKRLKSRFYLARQFWLPVLRRDPRWRPGRMVVRLPQTRHGFFTPRFGLWWGEHWFTGNRRVAGILLHPTPAHLALQRYLRWKICPDEAYYHTVLCNTPGLVIQRDNKRFVDWSNGGAHPKTLTVADLPRARVSGAHFARKIGEDGATADAADALLAADAHVPIISATTPG